VTRLDAFLAGTVAIDLEINEAGPRRIVPATRCRSGNCRWCRSSRRADVMIQERIFEPL